MTREEAIKLLEGYSDKWGNIPAYEDMTIAYTDELDAAIYMAISALRQQEKEHNEPLTLDELRKMDGEPVFVVCLTQEKYYEPPVGWRIIEKSIVGTFGVWNDSSCFAERDYGNNWLAYRQKPEEGTV